MWEPASQVPKEIIENYKTTAGIVATFSSGGQTIHTTALYKKSAEPEAKRPWMDASAIPNILMINQSPRDIISSPVINQRVVSEYLC